LLAGATIPTVSPGCSTGGMMHGMGTVRGIVVGRRSILTGREKNRFVTSVTCFGMTN
jgi:hypothetical protein